MSQQYARRPQADHSESQALFRALIVLMMLCLAVFPVYTLLLSMKDYRPAMDLAGSPWVGIRHYEQLVSGPVFTRVLGNSALLWITGLLLPLLLGVPLGMLAAGIRGTRLRAMVCASLLLPFFVSDGAWGFLGIRMLGTQNFVSERYYMAYILMSLLPGMGLISFATAAAGSMARAGGPRNARAAGAVGGMCAALLYACMALIPNVELIKETYNPAVYQYADVLSTYVWRTGLLNAQYGAAAAGYTLRAVMQLIIGILPALAMGLLLRRGPQIELSRDESESGSFVGTLALVLAIVTLLIPLAMPMLRSSMVPAPEASPDVRFDGALVSALQSSALCGAVAFGIGLALALLLVYSMSKLSAHGFAFCALLLLSFSDNIMGEYMILRMFGLINTVWPLVLLPLFSRSGLLLCTVCAMLLKRKYGRAATLPQAWPLLLAVACFAAAYAACSTQDAVVFISDIAKMPLGGMMHHVSLSAPTQIDTINGFFIVMVAPSLALGALGCMAAASFLRKAEIK